MFDIIPIYIASIQLAFLTGAVFTFTVYNCCFRNTAEVDEEYEYEYEYKYPKLCDTLEITLLRDISEDTMEPFSTTNLESMLSNLEKYDRKTQHILATCYSYALFKSKCYKQLAPSSAIDTLAARPDVLRRIVSVFMEQGLDSAVGSATAAFPATKLGTAEWLLAIRYLCNLDVAREVCILHPYVEGTILLSGQWLLRDSKYTTNNADSHHIGMRNYTLITLSYALPQQKISNVRFIHLHGIGFFTIPTALIQSADSMNSSLNLLTHLSKSVAITFIDLVEYICRKYTLEPKNYIMPSYVYPDDNCCDDCCDDCCDSCSDDCSDDLLFPFC